MQATYQFCRNRVGVSLPDYELLNWVTEYSEPFFCKCELPPEWRIELCLDTSDYAKAEKEVQQKQINTKLHTYPSLMTSFIYDERQRCYYVTQQDPDILGIEWKIKITTDEKSVKVYIAKNSDETKYVIARVLRSVLMGLARTSGWMLLHASCAKNLSGGVLCVGDKGAGKTAVMLSVLSMPGGGYVSNDRLMIKKVDCDYIAAGLPYSPAIRKSAFISLGICTINSSYIFQTSEHKIRFLTRELCDLLNVNACEKVKIGKLYIPQYGEPVYVKNASKAELITALKRAVISNICDFQPVWDYVFPAPIVDLNKFGGFNTFHLHYTDETLAKLLEG